MRAGVAGVSVQGCQRARLGRMQLPIVPAPMGALLLLHPLAALRAKESTAHSLLRRSCQEECKKAGCDCEGHIVDLSDSQVRG